MDNSWWSPGFSSQTPVLILHRWCKYILWRDACRGLEVQRSIKQAEEEVCHLFSTGLVFCVGGVVVSVRIIKRGRVISTSSCLAASEWSDRRLPPAGSFGKLNKGAPVCCGVFTVNGVKDVWIAEWGNLFHLCRNVTPQPLLIFLIDTVKVIVDKGLSKVHH